MNQLRLHCILLLSAFTAVSQAIIVADFRDDLQPTSPKAGSAYYWNSSGPVGLIGNYSALLPTTHADHWYDVDGVAGLPSGGPGAYANFGIVPTGLGLVDEGLSGGHPGRGTGDVGAGFERFVIAAYTLSVAGDVTISGGILRNAAPSTDGLSLLVFVNDTLVPILSGSTNSGMSSSFAFSPYLGSLGIGDVIQVAIGARGTDLHDTFSLDYSISVTPQSVPEPFTMALSLAAEGYGVRRIRKRATNRTR